MTRLVGRTWVAATLSIPSWQLAHSSWPEVSRLEGEPPAARDKVHEVALAKAYPQFTELFDQRPQRRARRALREVASEHGQRGLVGRQPADDGQRVDPDAM